MPTHVQLIREENLIRTAMVGFPTEEFARRLALLLPGGATPGEVRMALTLLMEEEFEAERQLRARRAAQVAELLSGGPPGTPPTDR